MVAHDRDQDAGREAEGQIERAGERIRRAACGEVAQEAREQGLEYDVEEVEPIAVPPQETEEPSPQDAAQGALRTAGDRFAQERYAPERDQRKAVELGE